MSTVTLPQPQTARDKLGAAHQLFLDAKAIIANAASTDEEKARIVTMIADARALKAQAVQLQEIEQSGVEQLIAEMQRKHPDAPLSRSEFKEWGSFLVEIWRADNPKIKSAPDPRLRFFTDPDEKPRPWEQRDRKDMSEASGAAGGYLVPTEFLAQLQAAVAERSIVRSRATVIPMRRRQLDIPVLDQTGAAAGVPHWFGGMRFYWAEEATAKTESDASFRQASLVAHKLIGYTRVSDELLDDAAISLAAFFSGPLGMAGGIAWMEDYAFLRGTGAGQPLGVLNAGATIVEPRAAAGAIGFDDLADMMEDFLPSGKGVWVVTQSAMSELIQLNGPAGNPSYIWQPNARDGVPGSLLGFPVIWSEKLP